MSHTIVTYTVRRGREQENAALVRAVCEELAQSQPSGFQYAVKGPPPIEPVILSDSSV